MRTPSSGWSPTESSGISVVTVPPMRSLRKWNTSTVSPVNGFSHVSMGSPLARSVKKPVSLPAHGQRGSSVSVSSRRHSVTPVPW